jgi:DNA repair exonuclease SbcCD nuclease subunit
MDFFNNFDLVLDYAKQNNADLVIHGGDLFFRTLIPTPIIDMVYERIFDFAESGIPIVIVPGNHESSRLPVSLFMQHPNIYYFTKPEVFKFSFENKNFDIAGFPCFRKEVEHKFTPAIEDIKSQLREDSIKLLCMHQSIEGAQVGPVNFTFRKGKDVIAIEDLPENYDLILSGHIHRAQTLRTKNNTPIIYPGSIERTAFAEKDEEKGFVEINIDNNGDTNFKFIPLPSRPMIDIQLEKNLYTEQSLKEEISSLIKGLQKDSIVRFKFTNNKNLPLLKVKLLDQVLPQSMNYQIAGIRDLYKDKEK